MAIKIATIGTFLAIFNVNISIFNINININFTIIQKIYVIICTQIMITIINYINDFMKKYWLLSRVTWLDPVPTLAQISFHVSSPHRLMMVSLRHLWTKSYIIYAIKSKCVTTNKMPQQIIHHFYIEDLLS
jgi:hypothetical protein